MVQSGFALIPFSSDVKFVSKVIDIHISFALIPFSSDVKSKTIRELGKIGFALIPFSSDVKLIKMILPMPSALP